MSKQSFTTGQVLTAAQVNSLQANDYNQTVSVKTASYVLVAADKGTRIEFNTSGSVTCTVNSGLFDAGDTLVIQNRGAGTATVTAGTATVNTSASLAISQYGQGILYFVDNTSAIFFAGAPGDITGVTTGATSGLTGGVTSGTADLKLNFASKGQLAVGTGSGTTDFLNVGTNGYTLVADSVEATGLKWAAASSDSYTQIASVSLTGAQTDITTISGSYKRLILVVRDFYVSGAGDNLVLRFNNSSTANSYHQSGVTRTGAIFNGGSFLWATYNTNVGSNQSNMFWMEIEDYANTATWKVASAFNGYYDGSNDQSEMFVYNWENTSAITEINLLATGGNLSGGTAILYGVK
jgi:hypothetical protein